MKRQRAWLTELGAALLRLRLKERLAGFCRAALVVALLAFCTLGLTLRSARAALGEHLMGFGAEVAHWDGFRLSTTPRRLSINGAELELVVATTKLPVSDALDQIEAVCDQRGGVLGAESLPKLLAAPTRLSRSWLNGHVRQDSRTEGMLACMDTGMPLGVAELTTRLQAFAKSGDLHALGALRYATVRRTGNVTTVLFVWSDGALPLRQMFPKEGDAPGLDPASVPRPEGSQRLLSGIEHGAPYSMSVYRTRAGSPSALLDWYREALGSVGFRVTEAAEGALLARQGGRTLVIHAAKTRRGVAAAVAEMK